MKTIKVKFRDDTLDCLVDDDDFQRFDFLNWYVNDNGYVITDVPRTKRTIYPVKVRLHRLIMLQTQNGKDVDHIDGNRLNNQKSNLRLCTRSQNLVNQGASRKSAKVSSKYKGVYYRKENIYKLSKPWFSAISVFGEKTKRGRSKQKYLGSFYTEEEAYEAYKKASLEMHGNYSIFKRDTDENKLL